MKLSAKLIRDFAELKVDDHRLAEDLTSIGIAAEGISGSGEKAVFDMEISTHRPDAMNHYGVAREASAFYDVPLRPIGRCFLCRKRLRPSPSRSRNRIFVRAFPLV